MNASLTSLPDEVIIFMLQNLHVTDIYEVYHGKICKLLSKLSLITLKKYSDLILIISSKKCSRYKSLLISDIFNRYQSITTSSLAVSLSPSIKQFIMLISTQIKSLILMDQMLPLYTNLSSVSQLHCCYPLSNGVILKRFDGLQWLTICCIDRCTWNLLSQCCPTLRALITKYSNKGANGIWWNDINSQKSLKSLKYLKILVICKSISIKLLPHLLKACPSLVHLSVDGRVTYEIDWSTNIPQRIRQTVILPKQLVSFGISSHVLSVINIDFSLCTNLKFLNIPLLTFGQGINSISDVFCNFIECKNQSDTIVLFSCFETSYHFNNQEEQTSLLEIQNRFSKTNLFGGSLIIILNTFNELKNDNRLITNIIKTIFDENRIKFVETNNVKNTITDHLISNCDDEDYIQTMSKASNTGFILKQFTPLIVEPINLLYSHR